jgi:hypothetical protein
VPANESGATGEVLAQTTPAVVASLAMFPNPATDMVQLQIEYTAGSEARGTVRIVNIAGQLVRTVDLGSVVPGRSTVTVSISDLSEGLYLVQLELPSGQYITKLQVAR